MREYSDEVYEDVYQEAYRNTPSICDTQAWFCKGDRDLILEMRGEMSSSEFMSEIIKYDLEKTHFLR